MKSGWLIFLLFSITFFFNICCKKQIKSDNKDNISGFPFRVSDHFTTQLLKTADSLFYINRNASDDEYRKILENTNQQKLSNYAIFQIRLTAHLNAQFTKEQIHLPDFSENMDSFGLLLNTIDSVFAEESINETILKDAIKQAKYGNYISGITYLALGLNSKYYKEDVHSALSYFNKSHFYLKKSKIGFGMLVFAYFEALQEAISSREYLMGNAFGDQALKYIKDIPEDTLMVGLAHITAAYSRMGEDLQFSLPNYRYAHEITKNSSYVFVDQNALKYLSHYHYINGDTALYKHYLDLYAHSAHTHGDRINLHKNLGQFAVMDGRWDDAIYHFEKAIDNYTTRKKPDWKIISVIYIRLKDAYKQKAQYDMAVKTCLAQVNIQIELPINWDDLYINMKNHWIQQDNNYIVSNELSQILFLQYKNTGDFRFLTRALDFCALSIEFIYNPLNTLEESKKVTVIADFANYIFNDAIELIYELYVKTQDQKYLEDFLNMVDISKASILFGDFSNHSKQFNIPYEYLANEKTLQSKIKKLVVRNQLTNDSLSVYQEHLKKIFEIYRNKYPEYFSLKFGKKTIELTRIQSKLEKDQSIVSYNMYDDKLFTFILKKDTAFLFKQTLDFSTLDTLIQMQQNKSLNGHKYLSKIWYKYLIPEVIRNDKEIIVVPDEKLYHLSFDALMYSDENEQDQYAIIRHKFRISPAITFLIRKNNSATSISKNTKISLFAFSDKESIKHQNPAFKELPGSYLEVRHLSKYFNNASTYLGLNATFNNFQKHYSEKGDEIIHLALHGYSETTQRDNAYLLFRNKNSFVKLDTLFGYDIESLFSDCKLIVLSACESGTGKVVSQEGSFSLARSFLRNGAESVISSLWNLDDNTTKWIMTEFYSLPEKEISQKLRQAKIKYLSSSKERHPFYWAGLVVNE